MMRFTYFTQTKLLHSLGVSSLGSSLSVYIFDLSGSNKLYLVQICARIWIRFSNAAEMHPLLSLKMTL
jgi:hypothetical protein